MTQKSFPLSGICLFVSHAHRLLGLVNTAAISTHSHKALHSKFHVILQKEWVSHVWPQTKAWGLSAEDQCVHSCTSLPSLKPHSNCREPTSTLQRLTWNFALENGPLQGAFGNLMGKMALSQAMQVCRTSVKDTCYHPALHSHSKHLSAWSAMLLGLEEMLWSEASNVNQRVQ
jgi:hypothetical protein